MSESVFALCSGMLLLLAGGWLVTLRANARLKAKFEALILAKEELAAGAAGVRSILDATPNAIVICDSNDGTVLYGNEQAAALGARITEPARTIFEVLPGMNREDIRSAMKSTGASNAKDVEVLSRSPENPEDDRWLLVMARSTVYMGRASTVFSLCDITDRKAAHSETEMLSEQRALVLDHVQSLRHELLEASLRDPLTGLHNRRYFTSVTPRELARCRRARMPISLLMVDADHFKSINDRFGHLVGDEVLRALGSILASSFRSEDVVCRFGGEEFVVLMPSVDQESAWARAEALRKKVAETRVSASVEQLRLTVSVGVAVGDADSETPEQLVSRADEAVYQAKSRGRNAIVLAPPGQGLASN